MKRKATTGRTKITSCFGLSSGEPFAAPEETENDCPPAKASKHRLVFDVSWQENYADSIKIGAVSANHISAFPVPCFRTCTYAASESY